MKTIVYGTLSMLFGLAFFLALYEDDEPGHGQMLRIDPAYAETTYTVEMLEQIELTSLHTVFPEEKIRYGLCVWWKKN